MARETRSNKEFSARTQETARWAREQIKRQAGKSIMSLRLPSHDALGSPQYFYRDIVLICPKQLLMQHKNILSSLLAMSIHPRPQRSSSIGSTRGQKALTVL